MSPLDISDLRLFIFDLDGVIYLGEQLVPGADRTIKALKDRGKTIYFLTNNSTRTRDDYVQKLSRMRIGTSAEYLITSAYATSIYLSRRKKNARIFIIGETGLNEELKLAGFEIIKGFQNDDIADFVVVGLDQYFDYQKLAMALHHILKGASFIATNDDPTLPTEALPLPGAGTMVKALSTCANQPPDATIGKPNPFSIESILQKEKCPPNEAAIIGDRISTDIQAGINAKIRTILVRTGAGQSELDHNLKTIEIDLILDSISDLL